MTSRPVTEFDRAGAAYIRATSGAKKIGQEKTAQLAAIPVNTFRHYWRGERSISMGDFVTIVGVLGVNLDEAFKEIDRLIASGNYAS
jgi:hypothetical protein